MSADDDLRRLALAEGIATDWHDAWGQHRQVSVDTLRALLSALWVDVSSPQAVADSLRRQGVVKVKAGPALDETLDQRRCFDVPGSGAWGLGVQVYALRSPGDGGLGHFGAVAQLAEKAAKKGADALGISPVHALFAADPGHYSPYAPSDRRFLNGLLCDPEVGEDRDWQLIEYPDALIARMANLKLSFAKYRSASDFVEFRKKAGPDLENFARFEALHQHFFASDPALWDWRRWPAPYRHPDSADVQAFAGAHAEAVDFHIYLQWLANRQLGEAQDRARAAGMSIGLIADLAVGMHPAGARAWADRDAFLTGISIGAPPDLLGPQGQNWGLSAFSPKGLRESGCAAFRADLEAAMRHAGGIRLDHVMGLSRLWCIPEGASATEGAYLSMPFQDLLDLVVRQSQARRCVVVGEDLGTVPPGLREILEDRNIMGTRVLWFERENDGRFIPAERYPAEATATTSTHDLPTIMGWWLGRDIDWRVRLGHAAEEAARAERARDRLALWQALRHRGLVGNDVPPQALDPASAAAVAAFVGATPSRLVLLPLEDALLMEEQPNLPGTTTEHPNWRRRIPTPTAELLEGEAVGSVLRALDGARKRSR